MQSRRDLKTRTYWLRASSATGRDSAVVIVCALVAAGVIFGLLYDVFDRALRRWTERDLNRRAHLIGSAVASHTDDISPVRLQRALDTLSRNGEGAGLVACNAYGRMAAEAGRVRGIDCRSALAEKAVHAEGRSVGGTLGGVSVFVTAHPIGEGWLLLVVQDRTFIASRRTHLLQMIFVAAEVALLALLLLARAGIRIGSRRTEEAARSVVRQMRSDGTGNAPVPAGMRLLVHDMHDTVARLASQRTPPRTGAERLRDMMNAEVPNGGLVVIANREPYSHEWSTSGDVVVQRPASGLVTGIEPILRACGGTWIAHGSGSADRLHSDRAGRLAVPPDAPDYTLRRLWLDDQEYERYYSGLANEGLWPLCHTAHTKPSFRAADWTAYQSVNEKFAQAAIDETTTDGLLLIQDYHFALVPRMVRERAPHIITSIFWHIPWPNSEVVGICPWKEALLEGMIGADIVGFHTRQYCLNFLETVQRYLECRVDLEEMSVSYGGHRTLVRPYPISIEWPYPAASRGQGAMLRRSLGIPDGAHVSIGVDRADYTKGLVERVAAVECLLELNPSLIGQYVLVQLASPTRTGIRKYQQLAEELEEAVTRVNARFGNSLWNPVVLKMRTFSPDEVREHYAMADSALVTPLHDGMNLVAKEYVAACEDGDGALVLSLFAGAARELEGALLVNPYDIEQVAQTILRAVRMPLVERRARMDAMREQIAGNSIYDWSGRLVTDMREVRQHAVRFWPGRTASATAKSRKVSAR
ncbi:MAG TPA: trehalose-6-phosphate synthase [Thermoanaerobaculia bacterium]|nr:trehalose-6-phosphate synthase [Thermoanaerobaculia bacterium]